MNRKIHVTCSGISLCGRNDCIFTIEPANKAALKKSLLETTCRNCKKATRMISWLATQLRPFTEN